jgi:hypothetical protein
MGRQVRAKILEDRLVHTVVMLKSVLCDEHPASDVPWSVAYLRARLAEHPATGYRVWDERMAELDAATAQDGARLGPPAGDQAAVPSQDGAGGYEPVHPQPCRQEPDQRGEDCAVGPVEPRPGIGAAQHGDLVPQHEQLGVWEGDDRPSRTSQLHSRAKMR